MFCPVPDTCAQGPSNAAGTRIQAWRLPQEHGLICNVEIGRHCRPEAHGASRCPEVHVFP